jgi:hypothetical protein
MSGEDTGSIGRNDNHEEPATAEQWAAVEFEPFDAAFCETAWNNLIPAAYTVMAFTNEVIKKSKGELVEVVRTLNDDSDGKNALMALLHDTNGVAEGFDKYAEICKATWTRLMIAATAAKLCQVSHLPPAEPVRQSLPALRQWYLTLQVEELKPGQSDEATDRLTTAQVQVEEAAIAARAHGTADLLAKAEILDWLFRDCDPDGDGDIAARLARSLCRDLRTLCRSIIPHAFEAGWWVDAAIRAGMEPELMIYPDGTRRIGMRVAGVDAQQEPPQLTIDPDHRAAVVDELLRRGMVDYL